MFEVDSERTRSIGTNGKRNWLYPLELPGRFRRNRRLVAYVLFALAVVLPWLTINGHPLLRFDPFQFKMTFMGSTFWPQELKLFFPFVLGVILLIVTVTTTYGRIWCGWACPQTVFLHFFYADIERLIEGRAKARRTRDTQPWTLSWGVRKVVKHALFLILSAMIGNLFLMYFLGPTEVLAAMQQSPLDNPFAFKVMLFIALFFYINFAFVKEVMCTIVCPYARFQSVLTDTSSMLISYDYDRGEPRSGIVDSKKFKNGDCVNCGLCVKVCPTGIDIRKGQQLECVGCALCIDACDSTMERHNKPNGLIRYTSENQMRNEGTKILGSRFFIYATLTVFSFILFYFFLSHRSPLQINITKVASVPYILEDGGDVRNMFTMRLRNKSYQEMRVKIESNALLVRSNWDNQVITLLPGERRELTFITWVAKERFFNGRNESIFTIQTDAADDFIPITSLGPLNETSLEKE